MDNKVLIKEIYSDFKLLDSKYDHILDKSSQESLYIPDINPIFFTDQLIVNLVRYNQKNLHFFYNYIDNPTLCIMITHNLTKYKNSIIAQSTFIPQIVQALKTITTMNPSLTVRVYLDYKNNIRVVQADVIESLIENQHCPTDLLLHLEKQIKTKFYIERSKYYSDTIVDEQLDLIKAHPNYKGMAQLALEAIHEAN